MPACLYIQIQEEANRAHEMAVTSLEDTVRSLEQKCIDAEENNINLKKEMEELRELEKASIKKKGEISHKSTQTTFQTSYKEVQTALENEGKKLINCCSCCQIHPLVQGIHT